MQSALRQAYSPPWRPSPLLSFFLLEIVIDPGYSVDHLAGISRDRLLQLSSTGPDWKGTSVCVFVSAWAVVSLSKRKTVAIRCYNVFK